MLASVLIRQSSFALVIAACRLYFTSSQTACRRLDEARLNKPASLFVSQQTITGSYLAPCLDSDARKHAAAKVRSASRRRESAVPFLGTAYDAGVAGHTMPAVRLRRGESVELFPVGRVGASRKKSP